MTIIAGFREAASVARNRLEAVSQNHSSDAVTFRQDLINIARTTLSSKILTQDKEMFSEVRAEEGPRSSVAAKLRRPGLESQPPPALCSPPPDRR